MAAVDVVTPTASSAGWSLFSGAGTPEHAPAVMMSTPYVPSDAVPHSGTHAAPPPQYGVAGAFSASTLTYNAVVGLDGKQLQYPWLSQYGNTSNGLPPSASMVAYSNPAGFVPANAVPDDTSAATHPGEKTKKTQKKAKKGCC